MAVFFAVFQAGCGSYQPAVLTATELEAGDSDETQIVRKGAQARVELNSGRVVEGEVSRVSEDSLSIGRPGNYGFEEDDFARGEIQKVEVFESSVLGGVITAVAIVGSVAVVTLAIALSNMEWDSN